MSIDEIPFNSLLSKIVDNRGRTCPVGDEGMPLIATNCINNDELYPRYETTRFVDQHTYETWFRGHPEPGDLIFVCKGSPGRVAISPNPVGFCIAQDMVAIRADASKIYPRYLFAAIRSRLVQDRITNMHVGSLIPHFKKSDFDKLYIPVPDEGRQVAIGDMYFELSDKIEQNRRAAGKLEELARAVFRAWFVDFAPVHAKAAGASTYPGLPQPAFDALPHTFTPGNDSPLGPIPKGWEMKRLGDVLKLHYGKSLTKTARTPGPVPVYGSGGINGTHNTALVDGPGIIVGRKGSVGTIYWEEADFYPIDTVFYVEPTSYWSLHYLYELLCTLGLDGMNTDAAVPGLNRVNACRLEVVVPPEPVADAMNSYLTTLRSYMSHIKTESRKLAELRDYLLPRLLSRTVRVKQSDVEQGDAK